MNNSVLSNPKRLIWIGVLVNVLVIAYAIWRGGYKHGNPSRYFDEGRFTMILSCLQLLASAAVLGKIGLIRKGQSPQRGMRAPWVIWFLMSAGFLFLTLDESFEIHESMDVLVHRVFNLEETGMSDRIDDMIIALYAVIGLGLMYSYRDEFKPFRGFIPYLLVGIGLTGITVLCDVVSNRPDILSAVLSDAGSVNSWKNWFSAAEGAATLLGELALLAGFVQAARTAEGMVGTDRSHLGFEARGGRDGLLLEVDRTAGSPEVDANSE